MRTRLETGAAGSGTEPSGSKADERAGKYLTFQLGTEEFGIQVIQVKEIIGLQHITSVPQTPDHVRGVINLRGKVTPVICLRLKFGMPRVDYTQSTCIIVVQVKGETGPVHVGLLVDGVAEVATLAAVDIENTPDFGTGVSIPYVLGMAKTKGKVRILLDIDAALDARDLCRIENLAKAL